MERAYYSIGSVRGEIHDELLLCAYTENPHRFTCQMHVVNLTYQKLFDYPCELS